MRVLPSWLEALLRKPSAVRVLGIWSFIESSVFPLPPDPALVAMSLARPSRAFTYAAVTTLASVAGGIAGYGLGAYFFDDIMSLIGAPHDKWDVLTGWYAMYGAGVVFIAGLTIIPYKLITIFSGAVQMNLLAFTLMSLLSRGLRFYLEAYLVQKYGAQTLALIEKWLGWRMAFALAAILTAIVIMTQ